MKTKSIVILLLFALVAQSPDLAQAVIVINEIQYDDGGGDDREFVELYNSGPGAVDISGWTIGGRDNGTTNAVTAIPGAVGSGTSMLAAGGYWVIGNANVANLSQPAAASGIVENDSEQLELWNGAFGTSTLIDGVVYEGFRGPTAAAGLSFGTLSAAMAAQVGPATYRGASNPTDLGATIPLRAASSVARYVDGVDTNNNGRDFGMRSVTPGASNATSPGTVYVAPNVNASADNTVVANHPFGFVGARVMTPGTVVAGLNENAIPAPPAATGATKVITAWDGSGGGNAVASDTTFTGGAQAFDIYAFLDTSDMPVNTNASAVQFRGSEFSWFGLAGSIDGSAGFGTALTSVSGLVGAGAPDSAVGVTGIAWHYEKVGLAPGGGTSVSEKLYLIDAGDGGNMNTEVANATVDEWVILAEFDLSSTPSNWYRLGISIDAAGVGIATFGNNTVAFATSPGLAGSFYVGYRENTQAGADGTPTFLRPPTYVQFVPEPSAVLFGALVCSVVGIAAAWRRLTARNAG